ncbi:sugar ABC transporter ATP-binding protein [Mesorhizobium sp. AaZ16]|uniref:sugar ABC transporter ATP-binding protein n=1 Tax=Mesorhizobium sp. AaZ16 TaxID=3402289 RepID=UPI00374F8EA9
MTDGARLHLSGIRKSFAGAQALLDGNLTVRAGEVHALMGANGAGKSTLMNVLGGIVTADAGEIFIDGAAVSIRSARDAAANGISFVHQELTMLPSMSVAENIFIDRFPTRRGRIDYPQIYTRSRALLDQVGCNVPAEIPVETLSTGDRQLIEIARALKSEPRIIILDEPTSSLSGLERKQLFEVVRRLKARGTAVIYITHFLDEVFTVCDAVTVMRNGSTVSTAATRDTSASEVLRQMLGDVSASERVRMPFQTDRQPLLTVNGLSRGGVLDGVEFVLRPGEIVGLWGLLGSGRTELVRALMGLDPIDAGSLKWHDEASASKNILPAQLREKTGLVTEDRRGEGLLLPFSIAENISLPQLHSVRNGAGLVDRQRERTLASGLMARLGVKAQSPDQKVGTLSGGNQQKVVFARWLPLKPKLFILDEPTRGLDTGAKTEILKLVVELALGGAAVLFISSEIEEIMRIADRYLVINRGRITAELPGAAGKAALMDAISSSSDRVTFAGEVA